MVKVRNWQRDLVQYINTHRFVRFEWGLHDCATFTRGAIQAMTGHDLALPEFSYRSKRDALRFQKTYQPSVVLKAQLNAFPVQMVFAQSGDILIETEEYERCYVIYGSKAYAPAPDCDQLQTYPLPLFTPASPLLLRFN